MDILLDTNILVRYTELTHRFHTETLSAVRRLGGRGHQLVIVP